LIERLDQESQALDARLPAFKEKFPQITVEREVVAGADLVTKLQTMAASDTLPDNVHSFLGSQSFHNFAAAGAFRNIDNLLARDRIDLKQWFPEVIDIMKIDGRLFGLPYKGQVLAAGFFYNTSVALGLQTKGSTTLGGRPDVWADPRILNHPQLPRQAQQVQLDSIKEIKEPYSAPANFRAPEVVAIRDPGTRKITDGQAKADPAFLRDLNGQMQPIMDLPRV
jgi:hypothetical protein